LGATHAVRHSTWRVFGDLGPGITCEDWVIAFRSSLLGEVVWSEMPGIRYRMHEQSIMNLNFGPKVYNKRLRAESNALLQFTKDLRIVMHNGIVAPVRCSEAIDWLERAVGANQMILDCIEADSVFKFIVASCKLLACTNFVVGNYNRRLHIVCGVMLEGSYLK